MINAVLPKSAPLFSNAQNGKKNNSLINVPEIVSPEDKLKLGRNM
jgi:hypothetical protein